MKGAAVRRYAEALFSLASEKNCLSEVVAGMASVRDHLANDKSVLAQLGSVRATEAEKHALIDSKVAAGAHPFVVNSLKLLVDRHREDDLLFFLLGFFEHMEDEAGIVNGQIESARAMSPEQIASIAAQLSELIGKKVVLEAVTVEDLIGGVRLTLGTKRIDASIKHQLDNIEARMMAAV